MDTLKEMRIDPSALTEDELDRLTEAVRERHHVLGAGVPLPPLLEGLLAYVVESMRQGHALVLSPEEAAATPQRAAQMLGMSRPYLVKLLDQGKIPYHRVGTHRRILLRDLRAFQAERDRDRHQRLNALTRAIDEAGVYDRFER
ncbi:MAG TPA: helix-turn-helix domain-containing protein [Armatimonadota bacterium]|jgi:excisionase family DNA binding protein